MSEIGGLPIVSNTRYGLFGPTNSFFFFFSNRKHWTQMFSNWMCILWFSTNRICYLSDPKGIFNLQHLLWFFFFPPDDQMLFHFISKYEELPQFFWEIRIALEFSLTLEGFDSAREVPPSISLFHLTRILQDASLETGDPCLEEPCHTCTYLKSERFCYWNASFIFRSHVTGLIPLARSVHLESVTLFHAILFLRVSISPVSLFNN